MGGNVFANCLTPRMPPSVYFPTRDRCHAILSNYYTHICTPLEAPEKTSFGDIDILVHGPVSNPPIPLKELGAALNAAAKILPRTENPEANFAIPWLSFSSLDSTTSTPDAPELRDKQNRFIQLDILTLPTATSFHFLSFTHAHSGLFTLLGPSLRQSGLILTPTSLSLRIPSIEAHRRRGSTLPLTSNPSAILDFLGLEKKGYWTRFESVEEMFGYVASSRLFTTRVREEEEGEGKVKHRNRRNSRRPLFVRWKEEFLPRASMEGGYDRLVPSREEVREEAFMTWPPARDLYEAQAKAFEEERQLEEVGKLIREGVPVDVVALGLPLGTRGAAMRGLKRILVERDESYGVVLPEGVKGEEGWDLEGVEKFVEMRWEEVGRAGLERGFGRMVEKREAKRGQMDGGDA
ncbi:hypothetical protein VC83_01094 [Pseudogymnoascus destructans]|uniref:Uncharacterized protein n=2 Tax=Pseudogymnoascus destructans TaxID=655981 RepID=L8G3G2_PSED2|nr:uncharacterized protein VC83_01094 [Pseudogymnoascus destructans]ELR07800.1 hypothetical protein GMDG_00421 [Pseudogymnoascus destructans 20631-21]OAF62282.1 hypothetical protein VC83_01094 [Pseudogymnoascus destructans]